MVLQVAVYAIRVAFFFADIAHEATAKKTAKQDIEHTHSLKIGVVAVGKIAGHANGTLYAVGIVADADVPLSIHLLRHCQRRGFGKHCRLQWQVAKLRIELIE